MSIGLKSLEKYIFTVRSRTYEMCVCGEGEQSWQAEQTGNRETSLTIDLAQGIAC